VLRSSSLLASQEAVNRRVDKAATPGLYADTLVTSSNGRGQNRGPTERVALRNIKRCMGLLRMDVRLSSFRCASQQSEHLIRCHATDWVRLRICSSSEQSPQLQARASSASKTTSRVEDTARNIDIRLLWRISRCLEERPRIQSSLVPSPSWPIARPGPAASRSPPCSRWCRTRPAASPMPSKENRTTAPRVSPRHPACCAGDPDLRQTQAKERAARGYPSDHDVKETMFPRAASKKAVGRESRSCAEPKRQQYSWQSFEASPKIIW
jgi:hypothetical protein